MNNYQFQTKSVKKVLKTFDLKQLNPNFAAHLTIIMSNLLIN